MKAREKRGEDENAMMNKCMLTDGWVLNEWMNVMDMEVESQG